MGSILRRLVADKRLPIAAVAVAAAAVATTATAAVVVAAEDSAFGAPRHVAVEPVDYAVPIAQRGPSGMPAIDRNRAVQAAQQEVPGATVLSAELDTERGTQVWEVDLRDAHGAEIEVTVDAGNAAVLSALRDDD